MNKSATTLAFLLLWLASVASAHEFRLLMEDGFPLSGARVIIVGRADSVVADSDGHFKLDSVPELPFVLFVARPDGVALRPVTIDVLPESGVVEVIVSAAGETVTVVSGVVPDLELPPAVAVTVMGRGDLAQRLPAQLFQTLENLPGTGVGGDGHAAVPSLRGLPQHRTLLLLDDGRVRSERRAGPSATYLDPETIEEVEVVRGPGSVAYGSDAFGGVIRSRTRMPNPQGNRELRWTLLGGTGLDEIGAAADLTTRLFGGGVLLGAHYRDYGDYSSPQGTVLNSGAEISGFRMGWQAAVLGGMLHLGWRTDTARNVGKPAPDSAVRRVYYPLEESNRLSLGFERPGPGSWARFGVSIAWDDYGLELSKDRFASDMTPREVTASRTTANDFTVRTDAERSLGEWRMVIGADLSGRYDLEAVNEYSTFGFDGQPVEVERAVSIEDANGTDVGVFTSVGRNFNRWHMDLGLRGDGVWSRNTGGFFGDQNTFNSALSGFVGLSYEIQRDLELTGQVARGFRDPLLSDRYYRGETGRGFITGNPELEPETSLQFDLALRFTGDPAALGLYVYRYRISDLIERFREDESFYFRNHGEAEIRGVEMEINFVIGRGLELQIGAHSLRGENLEDGSATDGVPAPGAFVVARGEFAKKWWWMTRGAAFARDDRPGPTEQEVPGYGVFDAGFGFKWSDAVEISLLGRNLLDHSYMASSDEDAVLAPGRSLQIVVRGRL